MECSASAHPFAASCWSQFPMNVGGNHSFLFFGSTLSWTAMCICIYLQSILVNNGLRLLKQSNTKESTTPGNVGWHWWFDTRVDLHGRYFRSMKKLTLPWSNIAIENGRFWSISFSTCWVHTSFAKYLNTITFFTSCKPSPKIQHWMDLENKFLCQVYSGKKKQKQNRWHLSNPKKKQIIFNGLFPRYFANSFVGCAWHYCPIFGG